MPPSPLILPRPPGVVTYPPKATFGPRLTGDYELVWVIEGDVVYERDGVPHPAPAESMVLCIPGHTDFFRWDPRRPTRHAFFHFDLPPLPSDAGAGPLAGLPPAAAWPVVRRCPDDDAVRPMFRHLLALRAAGREPTEAEAELISATVRAMLYAFVLGHEGTRDVAGEVHPPAVERALAFLHARLDADARAAVPLAALARAAKVTPEHLCRLFRKHTGHGPAETVRLARLDRAATLLARSNYTVAEVADLCGFASQFHFSRTFKAAYGTPPSELREAVRAGQVPPLPRLLRNR